jgi:RHS repeat-associated protein
VRYVRDYLNGSTSNTGDHWVEIEVYGSRTVAYIGNYYEWDASANTPTKYYYAGAERVAMRTGTGSGTTGLKWLLDNHASTTLSTGLGSTAITADGVTGTKLSELRYKPWGEIRYASQPTMTDRRYTGQRMEGIGLYDYGARWFDASLGRFVQADSIVPNLGDPQAWDRYAAMNNNPVVFVDPTGHMADRGGGAASMGEDWWRKSQEKLSNLNNNSNPVNKSSSKSDAKLLSFNFTAGIGGFYLTRGCDFLMTDDQIGVFRTMSIGPGLGGHTSIVVNREDEDRTFVTPQISFTAMYGDVFGDSLQTDVSNYQGTSLIGGGNMALVTSEYFSSVSPKTGEINNQITGNATGISWGIPEVGGYDYYSKATYFRNVSESLTNLAQALRLIH